ncbi:hypothetical protein OX90_04915 [Pseudomonas coronafaciens pv. porri]|uniref:Uncharacterized protein n=1 Tax=Pseudomonas coronafaciens pv. porri TaxID=83964 RepID=A0ABR5JT16_9PSED|nr:hypothetical protein OX90_04915 [Pseudomonas coronafaciens pv. porri]
MAIKTRLLKLLAHLCQYARFMTRIKISADPANMAKTVLRADEKKLPRNIWLVTFSFFPKETLKN